jgi:hypothetical protein
VPGFRLGAVAGGDGALPGAWLQLAPQNFQRE